MRLIDADVLKRKVQRVATEAWKMKLTAKIETTLNQFIDWINQAPTIVPEPQWIPCSERLPEKETVLATVETKTFKHRYVCEAVWIPRWTWKTTFDSWEDCSEYNEDDDEYYALEGWYERVHNWDDYSYVGIEDDVIAWQPLPEPWKGEQE